MDPQQMNGFMAQPNPYMMSPEMAGGAMGFSYPMQGIDYPGMNDVMCGRGGGTNNHIGNIRFRQLVNEHKLRYLAASKVDKPKVAMDVVQIWRNLEPPGRFLTKTDASQGDDSLWHDVGDKKAREKASRCLRERTPDVMPFVKQLQEKEKKKKEEEKKKKDLSKGGKGDRKEGVEPRLVADTTADTITSGATPDAALSIATPGTLATPDTALSNTSAIKPKKKSRDEVAQTLPTAAALMENIFDDEDDIGDEGLSFEAYQSQMQEFLANAPKGDEYSVTDRSLLMETMSTTSKDWVKSVQSVGSGSAMMLSIGNSLRDVDEGVSRPEMPESRSLKMKQANANSSLSMMSDLTDLSSVRNKSTRSSKMGVSRNPSNFSMMSELTDLSEGLKDMGLNASKANELK